MNPRAPAPLPPHYMRNLILSNVIGCILLIAIVAALATLLGILIIINTTGFTQYLQPWVATFTVSLLIVGGLSLLMVTFFKR